MKNITKTQETYGIVGDEEELRKFLDWLPPTGKTEGVYVAVLARSKYAKEVGLPTFNSDRWQCSRFFTQKNELIDRLYQREVPLGRYKCKGIVVPQEAIAVYCTVNHRNMIGARAAFISQIATSMETDNTRSIPEMANTHTHKQAASRQYIDFDIDGQSLDDVLPQLIDVINHDAVTIIVTRGGLHILVESKKVESKYKKTWYHNLISIKGCDQRGTDNLIPIPGTYQGGFIPRMYSLSQLMQQKHNLDN